MEAYQQRVIDEKTELDDKLKRLMEFQNTETFKNLSVQEIKRLNRQRYIMELYSDVLDERIQAFG